ncbi:MAG TPA: hypothetical protein VFP59_12115 [Candidatus Angelobacter sp.]|nr:hypothetical protein [Candidatus Angelobacter sp.]
MTSNNQNRVLMRMGARSLSENETDQVSGGLIPTRLTVINTSGGADHSIDT